ncbi:hypothetical protein QAD02_014506 [Eretmocerus hayati]|uniref:Uncharacterized protein n=1 Tax=Eretmocerus hayati TaxID=131215 RepID=A0ACC2P621_9HYME|nr:hypothetical protein QAD02_014506 [Eretmocerus hayati]
MQQRRPQQGIAVQNQNRGGNNLNDQEMRDDEAPVPIQEYERAGPGRIQLCSVYNRWIDSAHLTFLSRYWYNTRRLTRQLLTHLIGIDELTERCARGQARGRSGFPEEVNDTVEFYVNKKCNTKLRVVDFTNVVNTMIGTLRHAKPR